MDNFVIKPNDVVSVVIPEPVATTVVMIEGPQGLPGTTGQAGVAGEPGTTGPPGATGPMGATGPVGGVGPAGAIGPIGPTGPAGAVGATGGKGEKGDPGPTGPVGATGADVQASIQAAALKSLPLDTDQLPLVDSEASFGLKKLSWANLKLQFALHYNSLTATLTNKTLTNPRIGVIHDNNGNTGAWIGGTASAVNFLQMGNAATGGRGLIRAQGEANVGVGIVPRGTGTVVLLDSNFSFILETAGVSNAVNYILTGNAATGNDPFVQGWGSDANTGLNLRTRGMGVVRANGVPLVTTTGVQTMTEKTLTSPVINTPTGIVKADVGLGNVENTSDITKSVASAATLTTPRTINGVSFNGSANITIPGNPDSYTTENATSLRTLPRHLSTVNAFGFESGYVFMTYLYPRLSRTVNKLRILVGNAAAGAPTLMRFGIYQVNPTTGALTLAGSTANNTDLISTSWVPKEVSLTAPFSFVAGQAYAIGMLIVTANGTPGLGGCGGDWLEMSTEPKLSGRVFNQSNLPSTVEYSDVWDFGSAIHYRFS